MKRSTLYRWSWLLWCALGLASCTANGPGAVPPLPPLAPDAPVFKVRWWHILHPQQQAAPYQRMPLSLYQGKLYASGLDGQVWIVDARLGTVEQILTLQQPLSTAVTVTDQALYAPTTEGDLQRYTLEGQLLWSRSLGAQLLQPAVVRDDILIVQTEEGQLSRLNAQTGDVIWTHFTQTPSLSIQGDYRPQIIGDTLVSGFASGMITGLSLQSGQVLWSYPLSTAEGRTPVERLADVDGGAVVRGNELFVAGYQGNLLVLDSQSGRPLRSQPISTLAALSLDEQRLYVTLSDGQVQALDPQSLQPIWSQSALQGRWLSQPIRWRNGLLLSDHQGYVHVLAADSGELQGRIQTDWQGIAVPPIVDDQQFYTLGITGRLKAVSPLIK